MLINSTSFESHSSVCAALSKPVLVKWSLADPALPLVWGRLSSGMGCSSSPQTVWLVPSGKGEVEKKV